MHIIHRPDVRKRRNADAKKDGGELGRASAFLAARTQGAHLLNSQYLAITTMKNSSAIAASSNAVLEFLLMVRDFDLRGE